MSIRALVVDDEPLARRRLRRLLRAAPGFAVVGECGDGAAAVDAIARLAPDVVLLDVAMPGMNGLDVLEAIKGGADRRPEIVFVTAYDRYAVRAFDHHAVDYLLKPVTPERFQEALGRVRARLEDRRGDARALSARLAALVAELRGGGERFFVRQRGSGIFVREDEVEWIEASRNYVRLHVGTTAHVLRSTLRAIERRLDGHRFRRISRSALVNLDRVKELQPWFHGDGVVILRSGKRLTLSRRYRDNLIPAGA